MGDTPVKAPEPILHITSTSYPGAQIHVMGSVSAKITLKHTASFNVQGVRAGRDLGMDAKSSGTPKLLPCPRGEPTWQVFAASLYS